MSNFKNYILKVQGKTVNIDINGFINENFSKYIAKFAGYVFNEDINYKITDSGNINIEYDTGDNQKVSEIISNISSIKDLYDHITIENGIKEEGFKINGKEIKNLDDFKTKIKSSKNIPEDQDIDDINVLKNGNSPFFHITSSPINSRVKRDFIDFFITKRANDIDKIILKNKDNFNKIILDTFEKENKFFFNRKKLNEPITIGDIIASGATENLATCASIDKQALEEIKNIFNNEKKELLDLIKIEENKTKKNHRLISDLNSKQGAIQDFINECLVKIKNEKGIVEIKLYTEPPVIVTGTPKTK